MLNRDAVRTYNADYRDENRAAAILKAAERRARRKNIPYDLTPYAAHYQAIIDAGVCQLTGLPFKLDVRGYREPYSPSLDRVKPELGYVHGNVRIILWALNTAFATWGEEAFAEIAKAFIQSRK